MKKGYLTASLAMLILLAALLLCLPVGASSATADADDAREAVSDTVFDAADLLTDAEEQALAELTQTLHAENGAMYYVATYRAENRWDDYIGEEFCRDMDLNVRDPLIILIVTYDLSDRTYYYDMYAFSAAYSAISDKEANYILNHGDVYDNLDGGRIAAGAEAFLELSAKAYSGRVGVSMAVIIPICLVIAALIAFIVCRGVISSYKAKNKPVDYPLEHFASLNLTDQSDVETGKRVTAIPIPRNNGSGGGGRSAHGGGGGHRGGR